MCVSLCVAVRVLGLRLRVYGCVYVTCGTQRRGRLYELLAGHVELGGGRRICVDVRRVCRRLIQLGIGQHARGSVHAVSTGSLRASGGGTTVRRLWCGDIQWCVRRKRWQALQRDGGRLQLLLR